MMICASNDDMRLLSQLILMIFLVSGISATGSIHAHALEMAKGDRAQSAGQDIISLSPHADDHDHADKTNDQAEKCDGAAHCSGTSHCCPIPVSLAAIKIPSLQASRLAALSFVDPAGQTLAQDDRPPILLV